MKSVWRVCWLLLCWNFLTCAPPPPPDLDLYPCEQDSDCQLPNGRILQCCQDQSLRRCCVPNQDYCCRSDGKPQICPISPPYPPQTPCQDGKLSFDGTRWNPCLGAVSEQKERCNGLDDDCDGQIDEDWPLKGTRCFVGPPLSNCEVGGSWICDPSDPNELICSARQPLTSSASIEICDNKDNDCDGSAEQKACYPPSSGQCPFPVDAKQECCRFFVRSSEECVGCVLAQNQTPSDRSSAYLCHGLCQAGIQRCSSDQTFGECNQPILPKPEECDNKDNDCDGLVDEGCPCDQIGAFRPCYQGRPGTLGWSGDPRDPLRLALLYTFGTLGRIGATCRFGIQKCIADASGRRRWDHQCVQQITNETKDCTSPQTPDNNCDGHVDPQTPSCPCTEGTQRLCYTGPIGTEYKGICTTGTQSCKDGRWTSCEGQKTPSLLEICGNLQDDNCNGLIDEFCPCQPEQTPLSCYTGPPQTLDPSTQKPRGNCKAGKQSCFKTPDGRSYWEAKCEGQITPTPESCNAQDDDCDGQVDNIHVLDNDTFRSVPLQRRCSYIEPDPAKKTEGIGLCKADYQQCRDGAWTPCQGGQSPRPDIFGRACSSASTKEPDTNCDGLSEPCCPNNCSAGDECAPCGVSRCERNSCSTKCPDNCASDNDCLKTVCADKIFCINSRCNSRPYACSDTPCSSNNDCYCRPKYNLCLLGRCVHPDICPTTCSRDEDCNQHPACLSQQRNECVQGICASRERGFPACPAQCTDHEACQVPACGERLACLQGSCQKIPPLPP
ncbi:hypothetical protein L6R29_05635 [Myxococcota bacterium]|nr:hypothetical protein [Myxococcota bacterium]